MTSGVPSVKQVKYVVLTIGDKRFIVARQEIGLADSYVVICETKAKMNAKLIMEALAQKDERE